MVNVVLDRGGSAADRKVLEAMTLDAQMFTMTTRGFCVDGVSAAVGPTLRVKPGDILAITLKNLLEEEVSEQNELNEL